MLCLQLRKLRRHAKGKFYPHTGQTQPSARRTGSTAKGDAKNRTISFCQAPPFSPPFFWGENGRQLQRSCCGRSRWAELLLGPVRVFVSLLGLNNGATAALPLRASHCKDASMPLRYRSIASRTRLRLMKKQRLDVVVPRRQSPSVSREEDGALGSPAAITHRSAEMPTRSYAINRSPKRDAHHGPKTRYTSARTSRPLEQGSDDVFPFPHQKNRTEKQANATQGNRAVPWASERTAGDPLLRNLRNRCPGLCARV